MSAAPASPLWRWLRVLLFLALIVLLILAGNAVIRAVLAAVLPEDALSDDMMTLLLILGLVLYATLLAVPFVPGAEVGMVLLTVGGAKVAPLVYLATVTGLILAFLIGRLMPERLLVAMLRWAGLTRAAGLMARFEGAPPRHRARVLAQVIDARALSFVLRYRYVALGLAINTPGNVVLGGGGGLAMAAGLSRILSFTGFALTVAIAVLPVPLAIILYGTIWPV